MVLGHKHILISNRLEMTESSQFLLIVMSLHCMLSSKGMQNTSEAKKKFKIKHGQWLRGSMLLAV